MKQNRRFSRTTLPGIKLILKTGDGRIVEALLRNISLCGASVISEELLPVGTRVEVEVRESRSKQEKAEGRSIQGHIVRHTSNGMAIEFEKMDLDQFSHLKELISSKMGKQSVNQEITDFLCKKDLS